MSNPLDQITKKEPRKYDNIFDFPRFVQNEIMSKWKSYQIMKSHDSRRNFIISYLKYKWKTEDLQNIKHFKIENENNVQIKTYQFMDTTFYLISGVNRSRDYMCATDITPHSPIILYNYLEDCSGKECILFVDPIKDIIINARTIVSRDLNEYDSEWKETEEEQNIYSWYYKIYHDLCELVSDKYSMYNKFLLTKDHKISLSKLLVDSLFVSHYDYSENFNTGIVRSEKSIYNPNNIVMMILKSFHIYLETNHLKGYGLNDEYNIFIKNIIIFSKMILTNEFNNASVLEKSYMLKEKEYEINHE